MHVLIADDDPVSREKLAQWTRAWGYSVEAMNAGEAIRHWLAGPCHAWLALINLPGPTALECCNVLRGKVRNQNGFLLVAIEPDLFQAARENGADDVLSTPLHPELLHIRLSLIDRFLNCGRLLAQRENELDALRQENRYDGLTGLLNHTAFHQDLQQAMNLALRFGQPLTLCLGNLDNFRHINALFGNQGGDKVLTDFSRLLQENLDAWDLAGRLGGDLFGMAFPGSSARPAMLRLNRLREKLAAMRFGNSEQTGDYSLSLCLGVAEFTPELTGEGELYALAEQALTQAKLKGANQLGIHESTRDVFRADSRRRGIIVLEKSEMRDEETRVCLNNKETDILTGLASRREIQCRLREMFELARSMNQTLTLCLVDVDGMSAINRKYGHYTGDEVLVRLANLILKELRKGDFAGRFQGDEFCLLFPQTGVYAALNCLERIRHRLTAWHPCAPNGNGFPVSCAFGLAELDLTTMFEFGALLQAAAQSLELARQRGGNQIRVYRK